MFKAIGEKLVVAALAASLVMALGVAALAWSSIYTGLNKISAAFAINNPNESFPIDGAILFACNPSPTGNQDWHCLVRPKTGIQKELSKKPASQKEMSL